MHLYCQGKALKELLPSESIVIQAWRPLERDDKSLINGPLFKRLAKK